MIPLSGKCESIQTSGLKWDMGNSEDQVSALEFGGDIISTSNEIEAEEITIAVSHPVVWTTTLTEFYEAGEP